MNLDELKKLAGIAETQMSPVGSNISLSNTERRELEKKYNAKPGDELWFIINFTKPYLTGSVEDQIKKYLKKHQKD
jgi:hypothetical protein